jgi:hypothetical protein
VKVGDKPGHPFRGNQYKSEALDRLHDRAKSEGADRRIGITPEERAKADLYNRKTAELRQLSQQESDLRQRGRDVSPELTARVKQVATELVSKPHEQWTPVGGGKSRAELRDLPVQEQVHTSRAISDLRSKAFEETLAANRAARAGAPDLEHLSRENKIPANAAAIKHTPESEPGPSRRLPGLTLTKDGRLPNGRLSRAEKLTRADVARRSRRG